MQRWNENRMCNATNHTTCARTYVREYAYIKS